MTHQDRRSTIRAGLLLAVTFGFTAASLLTYSLYRPMDFSTPLGRAYFVDKVRQSEYAVDVVNAAVTQICSDPQRLGTSPAELKINLPNGSAAVVLCRDNRL